MTKELIKQTLVEQREQLSRKKASIEREKLNEISAKINLHHVHVITGIRRCGKSTLMRQIIKKFYNDRNFYYINFEDERFLNFKAQNFNDIYEALVELYREQKTFFIDGIQNISSFENFVRRFSDNGYKFFVTGSNSSLLSKEIGIKLTGRHIDTNLTPFTFKEYLKLKKYSLDINNIYKTNERVVIKKHFINYLKNGGMPEYATYEDNEILQRIYEDIITTDIAVKYKVNNFLTLRKLYQYIITNFAKRFSYNSLKKIKGFGSVNTVRKYIHYLEETYFIKKINKYDHSLKKQIANEKKIYPIDNGFISIISTSITKDLGWLLENMVFNFLANKYDVFYFSGKNECDFVCFNNKNIKLLVQVTYSLNENNQKREINGLTEAMKFFNSKDGIILTYDTEDIIKTEEEIINVIPLWKYILY